MEQSLVKKENNEGTMPWYASDTTKTILMMHLFVRVIFASVGYLRGTRLGDVLGLYHEITT